MKIIQIMPEFYLAGAERMAEALCLKLKEAGHTVIVVSMFDIHTPITDNLEQHDIPIHYLGKKRGLDLRMIPRMVRVFRKEKPDIIHTHRYVGQYAIPAAILAGVKHRVHTVHSMADTERLKKGVQRFFYHHCRLTPVAISDIVKASVCRLYQLDPAQVPVILNGIPLENCCVKTDYHKAGTFRFVHVGRFSPVKNHLLMVKAFETVHRKYPDTSLTFIGTGEIYAEVCREISRSSAADCIFAPGVVEDIAKELASYDVFLLPSQYEGVPLSLIEAMASGLPIAAAEVGGIPDMMTAEEHGLLCQPDADSLAEAMERLYLDEALRRSLGQAALAHCEIFSDKTMTHAYLNVYKSL